ncbi:histone-lysine N-methyltransferase eggless isoform X2 [Coccinella septempunctata]|uniref:histone-lysine N-methyltransferase eggless isoform X1 n=1 Tax=Coccinella septempunctata TaxID=41139 RepID=UPI001D0845D8|nr:histone-lysine N-methyltransferase eggless isoform X1 [Coccinella septempunctata]XP_044762837.1 histone-lysine N-methyltransferase eggless isoform X1 [Coccinella septempunctata]XP_044762838.1 histone-lysine N-methyltransferase eggless isoform X2 [Coccinella septempunctata]
MEVEENVDDPMEIDDTIPETQIIEKSNQTQGTNENALDVVVLDDDEDDSDKTHTNGTVEDIIDLVPKNIGGDCINYSCKGGKELIVAPVFCLSYYRVKSSNKMEKKVCLDCYKTAVRMYDSLVTEMKTGKLLFDVDVPILNDMVEIEDSDEEETAVKKDEDYLDEDNFKFIEKNIDDVLHRVMAKFNLKDRIKKEEDSLKKRFAKTQEDCKQLRENLQLMRKEVDKIQIDFYNDFRPEIRDSPMATIIIDDFMLSNDAISRQASIGTSGNNSLEPSRKSNRRVKPVSYSEIEDITNSNSPKPATPPTGTNKETEVIPVTQEPTDLPPKGPTTRPPLEINEIYYISRDGNPSGCWVRARLNNVLLPGSIHDGQKCMTTLYKLTELKQQRERVVGGKNIAYINPCPTRLRVGDRVIAGFKEGSGANKKANPYYPGVVAEPPYEANKYRYLIFFDIGYSQYVPYNMVNLVYEVSRKVWEDMPPDCRQFIKKHIESQDWPMVKLKKDQSIITEYNGKWVLCTVINVDCSLVQVFFDELNRFEWIYRGSRRIKEIYREELAAQNRTSGQRASRKGQIESKNIVQYTPNVNFTLSETGEAPEEEQPASTGDSGIEEEQSQPSVRAVARKSTAKPQNQVTPAVVPFLPPVNNAFNATGPTSKIMYFTPRDQHTMKRPYRSHACSPKCKDFLTHNFSKLRGQNPLSKPLLCGWARMTVKGRVRKDIAYKAPCGRLLRNIAEVHYYLSITKSEMTVDLFDFNHMVRCLAEFSVDCEPDPKDLSKGLEQVTIPVINGINNEMLDFCNYSTKRVPMEGVKMNLDPNFLVCCDCDDDCIDKTKCPCWKLTLEGAKFFDSTIDPNSVGYIYRRLQDQVVTGIYECNSRCKCNNTCLNRVAQHPMSLKLQVFRTHNRGWGIRCLNDVPQGAFICVYAGTIHTDQMANEDGKTYGDEYFAELDYIESVEKFKEDYEKEVNFDEVDRLSERGPSPSEEMEVQEVLSRQMSGKRPRYQDDNEFVPPVNVTPAQVESRVQTRLRKRKPQDTDSDSRESEPERESKKFTAIRTPLMTPGQIKKEIVEANIAERLKNIVSDIDTVTISDDEDEVREVLSFNPKNETELDEKSKYLSVRELYGADESIYIMDAKNAGNIGRFLNHSCAPNVFVQNVFVDTHDPRFPWVAFFSSQFIRAGTELTWNYSYDVGSVPGKILYCHCAALECKGRLL